MQQSINHEEKHYLSQGRFMFLKSDILGKGATGTVYKGYDYQENQKVAIKVIQTSKMNQVEKSLIENEKKALKMLKHSNIMKLIHIDEQPSYTFIISQLYEGGSLEQYLSQNGNFSELEAMQFFRKIISGYCAIVEANIIHRDLKPMNILLTKSNQPVIIDFGYSQIIVANKNLTVFNVGSPSYMSPQAFSKTIFSQKSDVWSLGSIFYQLLTNKTLDENISSKQYFQLLKNSQYPPINFDLFSEVSKEILKSALAVKPQQRGTAHRIKYLLDKEILGKQFQGKTVSRPESSSNQLRQTISNTRSVAKLAFKNNDIDFSNMKRDDNVTTMFKKPSIHKTFSSIPLNLQKPKKNSVRSALSIQGEFKKQEDCIIQKQSQADYNFHNSSVPGSLNITSSISRIQYIPAHQYQKSFGPVFRSQNVSQIKGDNHLIQGSGSSQIIKMNSFHPKIQRQISLNSNNSDSQFFIQPSYDKKSASYNEGFYNGGKNNQMIPEKNSIKNELFYSTEINPPLRADTARPNIPLSKHFSTPSSESYGKIVQKTNQNENFTTAHVPNNMDPISMKLLVNKLERKTAVQHQVNLNGTQNYGLRQKNQCIDQSNKVYQTQKLYQSQQNSPYQKINFQQALRTTISPQSQFNFQRGMNVPTNPHFCQNPPFNRNQAFGQFMRNTIDSSSRPLIELRKII